MKKLLSPNVWSVNAVDWASLILRLTLGLLMLFDHGLVKLTDLINGVIKFGDPIGFGVMPSLVLTIFAEVFCSLLVIIGLWTRLAVIPLIITMLVATFIVHLHHPMIEKEGALHYLLPYTALFLLGSGRFSVDALISKAKKL